MRLHSYNYAILLILFACIYTLNCDKDVREIPRRHVKGYRAIPWCVNGVDEPEFRRFPLTEFQPFLSRDFGHVFTNVGE